VFSILGINKRNLEYIKKLNPRKTILLANNKIRTKTFLAERWIPIPQTYKLIKDRNELLSFDFSSIGNKNFVVKPNMWSKWKWIFIVNILNKYEKENKEESILENIYDQIDKYIYKDIKKHPYGLKSRWKVFSDLEFKKKLVPILEGNYTLSNKADTILIEEKILPWAWFEKFCEYGLADIRVIVFNMVPVAAMLRMPTSLSGWVANIAQWWIACGIDISTGMIKTIATKSKIYYDNFPDEFRHLYKFVIPFWDDVLAYSSNIQYFVNMWYIGIDRVITNQWPKLLEINGKSGLEIQNVTGVPLQKTLDRISWLVIPSPERWIEVAKSLFTSKKETSISSNKIIYLSQRGSLFINKKDNNYEEHDIILMANPKNKKNYASEEIVKKLRNVDQFIIKANNISIKDIKITWSNKTKWNRVELWTDSLKNFYIKPIHKSQVNTKFISSNNLIESELDDLVIMDRKIAEIQKQIILSSILIPVNYLEQLDIFVSRKERYDPIFEYNFPSNKELINIKTQLKRLRDEYSGSNELKSNFAKLFYDKITYIEDITELVSAYKKQNFDNIKKYNQILFWEIDEGLVLQSQNMTDDVYRKIVLWSKKIALYRSREIIDEIVKKYKISRYKVSIKSNMLSRISFQNTKIPIIKINPKVSRFEWDLRGQLEHEIWWHFVRGFNGAKTQWSIMNKWTANYIIDEEWLCIYKAEKTVQSFFPEYYNHRIYNKYMLVHVSENMSFSKVCEFARDMHVSKSTVWTFKKALKLKRGIKDTSYIWHGSTYMKDKVYLDGYRKINKWIDEWWNIEDLMIGKVKIEDLELINEEKQIGKP